MQGSRVLFQMWIIYKFYSKEIRQKKTSAAHTRLVLFSVIFLYWLFTLLMTFKGKKPQKLLSKQFKQFYYYFDLKDWVSKLNIRLSFDLR